MQSGAVAVVLVLGAPAAGNYFGDLRVVPVLQLMALNLLIISLENIGIVDFQKQMQFGREFRYLLINRLFGLICTVGLALALRSYWALVLATSCTSVFTVLHSYLAHPLRARWSTKKLRELLGVSQWMLVQNVGGYLDQNLHKLLVGRRDDTATMGAYSVAADVAAMPSTELLQPINRVLFPALVSVKDDLQALKQKFLLALSLQTIAALPASACIAVLAPDLVPVLLGERWLGSVPLLQLLALSYAALALQSSAWYVSITLGKERACSLVSWTQVLMFATAVGLLLPAAKATEIAEARIAMAAVGLGLQLLIVARALGNLSPLDLAAAVWRPVVATAIVAAAIMHAPWPEFAPLPRLLAQALAWVALQVGACWILWALSGRPDGAERYLVAALSQARTRRLEVGRL